MAHRFVFSLAFLFSIGLSAIAEDWPQWNGPSRDGSFNLKGKIVFPNDPSPSWKVDVGLGYAGPVIAGEKLVLTDYRLESGDISNNAGKRDELSGQERITCYDRSTGQQIWQHAYDRPYKVSYPSGPRATPTIHRGMVYVLGSEGDLLCLEMTSGLVVWQTSFTEKFGAQTPLWGHAASPLIYGNSLICMVGGPGSLVVAFDPRTGKVKWKTLSSENNETGYCPPTIVHAGGAQQLMIWSPTTLYSLNPDDGSIYWQAAMKPDYGMSILPPVTNGQLLFVSGEGSKSAVFRLSEEQPAAELLWRGKTKDSLYLATSNAIYAGQHIYGADIRSGTLICFEAESGERQWRTAVPTTGSTRGRGAAHASAFLIRAGDSYLILSETGDLIHATLSPEAYREISRFHALEPTSRTMGRDVLWTYPAFDGECIYVRNDKHLVCYHVVSS
ncbi:MAG: PQQ-binding-like beta-propeller repeat protein [Planctomycetota bacterium]